MGNRGRQIFESDYKIDVYGVSELFLCNYMSKEPLVIILYDYELMFYDCRCNFKAYHVSNLKDFILTVYEDNYRDYRKEVDEFRKLILNIYDIDGEDAAIQAMEKAESISFEKIKCFRGHGALDVLNFMENY